MDNVIGFPETMTRQWHIFERVIGDVLADLGLPDDEITHALSVIRPIYLRFGKPENFKGTTAEEAVDSLNRWVQQLTSGLLLEVVSRELELYRLGARTKPAIG